MKVHFYGRLAETLGPSIEVKLLECCSIAEIRERIAVEYPLAGSFMANGRNRACVGDAIVAEDYIVRPNESVEFFPPVSGG